MPPCTASTASGAPCRKNAVAGYDRCAFHISHHVGRKTTLTPEIAGQLVGLLSRGNYTEIALRAVGVPERTFRHWLEWGRRAGPGDGRYVDFLRRVEQARALGEARNVDAIQTAAQESWQAAAWLLERMAPERWGKPSVRMRDEAPAPAAEPPDEFQEVDELAARRHRRP